MRRLALTAAIIAAAVDIFYLGYAGGQTGPSTGEVLRVPFVAGTIALAAAASALAARPSSGKFRPLLLGFSTGALITIGFFGIFSIGFPLLLAGVLTLVDLLKTTLQARKVAGSLLAIGGIVAAIVIVLAGFEIAPRVVVCPPTGSESSSGVGPLGDSYRWSCTNGKFTMR